jgi:putative nucleotidyltransferase with HDIG domain
MAVYPLRPLKDLPFDTDTGKGPMPRETPLERVSHSVTLLRAFLIVSALLLAAGGFVLGTVLTHALRDQALDDAKRSLAQYTSGVLGSSLVYGSQLKVGTNATTVIRRDLAERPDILSVKVWRRDGVLAWTTLAPERIGRSFPVTGDLSEVIEHGRPEASFEETHGVEDAREADLGVEHVIEVYAPVVAAGEVIGAYEIYADAAPLEASIAGRKQVIWLTTAGVFLALWALLVLLVRRASDTLRRQTTTLRERSVALANAYEALERNALEAVESLNATVEAKDPYTAGHSLRVQRIALALGDELGFTPVEMDALRFGALFHDIGKIAVPDGVLTKPGRLSAEEYEEIKRHSVEGARIIEKFSRLREAVPIVRHHHERWDGNGYPDGLSADAIPVAAAIAGLADAWDAMTTDRPYQGALPLDAAMNEVRNGRGTQFIPVVVDAFFAVANRRPQELWIDEAESRAAS